VQHGCTNVATVLSGSLPASVAAVTQRCRLIAGPRVWRLNQLVAPIVSKYEPVASLGDQKTQLISAHRKVSFSRSCSGRRTWSDQR
jgi:hypothetical protein